MEIAAQELRKTNSLIGTALRLLTDDSSNQDALKTSLGTLIRVLDAVNWHTISKDDPEEWLYFYENFLEVYDNDLRKETGSYYTPVEVVQAMVNLVDEALRGPLFERAVGFAASDVIVADRRSEPARSCLACSAVLRQPSPRMKEQAPFLAQSRPRPSASSDLKYSSAPLQSRSSG